MASALIRGLLNEGYDAKLISASDPNAEQRSKLANTDISLYCDNQDMVDLVDILVLAVKPQVVLKVLEEIKTAKVRSKLIISIAAGISLAALTQVCGDSHRLVRAMPNTPALVALGATGVFAENLASSDKKQVESLFSGVGIFAWLESEAQMDAVTALSGSGPAYFMLFMEAMINAGQQLGLSAKQARLLTVQTAVGAAKMVDLSATDIEDLRIAVTSPGGTTAAALKVMLSGELPELVGRAMLAARDKSIEIQQTT